MTKPDQIVCTPVWAMNRYYIGCADRCYRILNSNSSNTPQQHVTCRKWITHESTELEADAEGVFWVRPSQCSTHVLDVGRCFNGEKQWIRT